MKVMCNGFNLYGQLNNTGLLLVNFARSFQEDIIKDFCISHSYSVVQIDDYTIKLYPKEDAIHFKTKIVQITSNDERILVLDETGKVYKLEVEDFLIQEVPFDSAGEKIAHIKSGAKITVSYTNKGRLCSGLTELKFRSVDIVDIQCGREHCLLLDKIGYVYAFGAGSRGQLGLGELENQMEPQLIEALAGIKIDRISTGGWHSCALSNEGDLYVWGWNGNGQLGLVKNNEDEDKVVRVVATPQLVDFELNVLKVACGSRHTVVLLETSFLLDNKELQGAGWNKYKQLKDDDNENFFGFTNLHAFGQDEVVVDVKCGPWNTAVLSQ